MRGEDRCRTARTPAAYYRRGTGFRGCLDAGGPGPDREVAAHHDAQHVHHRRLAAVCLKPTGVSRAFRLAALFFTDSILSIAVAVCVPVNLVLLIGERRTNVVILRPL